MQHLQAPPLLPEYTFSPIAEARLYHLSASYTRSSERSRIIADELRREVENRLLAEHGGPYSIFLCTPGESAWRTIITGRVRAKPLWAELTYLVEPTYRDGLYVPLFEICVIVAHDPVKPRLRSVRVSPNPIRIHAA